MGLKRLTKFNKLDGGLKTSQIFGNTLEALVGAIYIDKKYEFTKKWIVNKMIQPYLFMDELELIDINIKNKINHLLSFLECLTHFHYRHEYHV